MRKRPVRLWLEALEDRWCPSLTVQNASGYLIISGTPVGTNAAGGLLIQGTAARTNFFTIKDGSTYLGTYQVTNNLYLNLNNHQSEGINIDLNSNTIPGNLFINLGTGNNTGNVQFSVAVYNSTGGATTGRIGGNLQVVNGSGSETVIPGFQNNFSNAPPAFGLRVGGDLTFNAKVGGPTPSNFDVLDTGAGSAVAGTTPPTVVVGGNVNTTAVDAVGLGPTTTVGKSVSIAAAGERPLFVQDFATVQGNVGITGSQTRAPNPVIGPSQLGNFIEVGGFPTGTAFVGGSLQMSAGPGDAFFLIDAGTTVNGTTGITSSSGSDTVSIGGGNFNSNLTLNMGDGNDSINLAAGTSVLGSMSLNAGNGNNFVTDDATVGSTLTFNFGNGDDTVTIGSAPGGMLNWTSGSGNDSVTFGDATNTPSTWNVNMRFGTGNDTLTLAGNGTVATPNFLTGFIDMGGPPGGNSFDPTGSLLAGTWVIVQPFTLQNV